MVPLMTFTVYFVGPCLVTARFDVDIPSKSGKSGVVSSSTIFKIAVVVAALTDSINSVEGVVPSEGVGTGVVVVVVLVVVVVVVVGVVVDAAVVVVVVLVTVVASVIGRTVSEGKKPGPKLPAKAFGMLARLVSSCGILTLLMSDGCWSGISDEPSPLVDKVGRCPGSGWKGVPNVPRGASKFGTKLF